jgi:hypothetical protein
LPHLRQRLIQNNHYLIRLLLLLVLLALYLVRLLIALH